MNILFELNHPRHYYQFQVIKRILKQRGHKTYIAATDRGLLIEILNETEEEYVLLKHTSSGNRAIKFLAYAKRFYSYSVILRQLKINVLFSKASVSAFFTKLTVPSLKAIIYPDSEVVWLTNNFVRHFSDLIFIPDVFPLSWPLNKVVRVKGTCENCYLDPRYFQPEHINPAEFGYSSGSRFVFFRFVAWKANHDIGQYGFSSAERIDIIDLFVKSGYTPLISFEGEPDFELKQFVNRFPKSKIRSVLSICEYYVGDSQSMASEAALLGVKSFRYNSWVKNDLANFKFFHQRHLLLNFSCYADLKTAVEQSLSGSLKFFAPIKDYWEECGDVNKFICDKIEERFVN